MPLKIGNYGNWEGDRPGNRPGSGYHPPACTCYSCNENRANRDVRNGVDTAELRRRARQEAASVGRRTGPPNGLSRNQVRQPISSAAKSPNKRWGRLFLWCIALVLVIYAIYIGSETLSIYRADGDMQLGDLPGLFAQQAVAPLQSLAGVFT